MRKSFLFVIAALLVSVGSASRAHADSPPPDPEPICDGAGKDKCTSCDKPLYTNAVLDDYDNCVATAKGKGLIESACTQYAGGGGSTTYFFCPAGVTLTETSPSSGCSIGGDPSSYAGFALLAGLGLLWRGRARRRS